MVTSTGEVVKGAYICNENGNYLMSKVQLSAGLFSLRSTEWYKSKDAIASFVENYEMLIDGDVRTVPMLKYYRTDTKLTGDTFTAFIQKVESVLVAREPYTPLFKVSIIKLSTLSSIKRSDFTFIYQYLQCESFQS